MAQRRGLLALLVLVLVVAGYAVPLVVTKTFWQHLMVMGLINAIVAMSLNIIVKTGQVSLAQAAFMGLGAYTSAQLTLMFQVPFLLAFLAAGLLSAVIAVGLGRLILHLKGVYFILFTFALGEFGFLVAKDFSDITGGNTGLVGIKAPRLPFVDGALTSKASFYTLAFTVFLLVLGGLAWLYRSPFGRAMDAVRESELLAASTGYDVMRIKIAAFAVGAFIAGLGGSLFAHFLRYIAPFNFTFWESVNFLLMNIIGGSFSLAGPIIGAVILTPLPELLREQVMWQQVIYGVVLMLFMRFLPDGVASIIAPTLRRLFAPAEHNPPARVEPAVSPPGVQP
jgi:branched-chain amino acid transport system permease protein